MITVRLYGLLRLNSGLKEVRVEADTVKTVFRYVEECSNGMLKMSDLRNCVIIINGKAGTLRTKLRDGDEIMLLSPVAGG